MPRPASKEGRATKVGKGAGEVQLPGGRLQVGGLQLRELKLLLGRAIQGCSEPLGMPLPYAAAVEPCGEHGGAPVQGSSKVSEVVASLGSLGSLGSA